MQKPRRPKPQVKVLSLPKFRGGPLDLLRNHDHEVILCGGSDMGKTWAGCTKSFMLCADKNRSNVHGIMVRKVYASIEESCARTFKAITAGMPVERLGGRTHTEKWIFPNGSELVTCGMDKPDKLLSSEWDFVQVVQAEQLAEADWETIGSRCTGRGAVVAYPQVFGDCNPGPSRHWIRRRAEQGKLKLLSARHQDNPALYDEQGNITAEGTQRIGMLEQTLSGVRRQRLLLSQWVTAEGAVFDMFSATVTNQQSDHVQRKDPEVVKRWLLCQDEGYTNPAAVLLCGDDSDGRRHVFREWYERGKVETECAVAATLFYFHPVLAASGADFEALQRAELLRKESRGQTQGARCELNAVDDAAASLIKTLKDFGLDAKGGKGRILDGIKLVQDRLKVAGDGRPRLTVDPSCVNLINEFESHVWKPEKDIPVDADNHAIAALRYLEDVLAVPSGALQAKDVAAMAAKPQAQELGSDGRPVAAKTGSAFNRPSGFWRPGFIR